MGPIAHSNHLYRDKAIRSKAAAAGSEPSTLLELVARDFREAWLGDLVEGSFLARPTAIRRWLGLFVLRMCTVTFVFGVPWVLMNAPGLAPRWLMTTAMLVLVTPVLTHRRRSSRARAVLGYGLFLAVACPLLVGWTGAAAFQGFFAAGALLMLAGVHRAMAAGEGQRREL